MRFLLHVASALAAALLVQASVLAQPATGSRPSLSLPIDPQLLNDLPELSGVVSWKVLGQARSEQSGGKSVARFGPDVAKLDRQEVRVQGYLMPINAGERHSHFLLTMRPPHCPYCLSVGPEYLVEVKAKTPIRHTYEPIVVAGRLELLRDDPYGLFYRLTDAQLAPSTRK